MIAHCLPHYDTVWDLDKFDAMSRQIILISEGKHEAAQKDLDDNQPPDQLPEKSSPVGNKSPEKPKSNKGMLIVDATVADHMIAHPTDMGFISRSREESERIIDELCKVLDIKNKPRTYRRLARKQYLNTAKKRIRAKMRYARQ